ncbi:MAG TPA: hypothetical protein DCR24_05535, partial [Bacillus bacterium]|nr:hypothetical protein [Bacillus sp. (in: firmicutes)]
MFKLSSKVLAGTLAITLAGTSLAWACEDGQKSYIEAGASTFGGIPLVQGSKNFMNLQETAA